MENLTSPCLDTYAEAEDQDIECLSEDIMKNAIRNTNDIPIDEGKQRVLISLDIELMYPSQDKDTVKD